MTLRRQLAPPSSSKKSEAEASCLIPGTCPVLHPLVGTRSWVGGDGDRWMPRTHELPSRRGAIHPLVAAVMVCYDPVACWRPKFEMAQPADGARCDDDRRRHVTAHWRHLRDTGAIALSLSFI